MGKVMAMKQGDKLPTAREPLRVFPYVYKRDELAKMRRVFASAIHITEMDAVSLHYTHVKRNIYVGCKRLARHGRRSVLVRAKKELDVGQAVSSGRFILSATKSAAQDRHAPSNL